MTGVYVTHHAVERYLEPIIPTLTFEEARARIIASSKAIKVAAAFGCTTVRTGDGATVVTVIHRSGICYAQLRPLGRPL